MKTSNKILAAYSAIIFLAMISIFVIAKNKEHFKKLRTEVDVLTLTATPIPRTLYMALTGVRDISTINTPPEERLPIVTHIGPY